MRSFKASLNTGKKTKKKKKKKEKPGETPFPNFGQAARPAVSSVSSPFPSSPKKFLHATGNKGAPHRPYRLVHRCHFQPLPPAQKSQQGPGERGGGGYQLKRGTPTEEGERAEGGMQGGDKGSPRRVPGSAVAPARPLARQTKGPPRPRVSVSTAARRARPHSPAGTTGQCPPGSSRESRSPSSPGRRSGSGRESERRAGARRRRGSGRTGRPPPPGRLVVRSERSAARRALAAELTPWLGGPPSAPTRPPGVARRLRPRRPARARLHERPGAGAGERGERASARPRDKDAAGGGGGGGDAGHRPAPLRRGERLPRPLRRESGRNPALALARSPPARVNIQQGWGSNNGRAAGPPRMVARPGVGPGALGAFPEEVRGAAEHPSLR
jgi:hypothetical protein